MGTFLLQRLQAKESCFHCSADFEICPALMDMEMPKA